MKIVNIILTSQNGGAEQAFIDYLSALKKLGHTNIAILKEDAPYAAKIEDLGISVIKISNKFGYYDVFAINRIKRIVEDYAANIVVSHANRSNVLVRKALRKIKSKKIHQIAVNHSANVKRSIGSDIVISVNSKIMAKTVDLGQSYDRSFVVPNAINLEGIVVDKPVSFTKDKIVIGALGRFDRTKGFDLLIKAVAELKKVSEKKFVLKLAGAGYFEQDLKKLVKDFGIEDRVEFLGWISDKSEFFSGVDIFCIPSKNEPFGIVVLEAMKYGKPIVATSADGPMEILSNGKDSIIVNLQPEESVADSLSKAFQKISSDEFFANNIVKNATEKLLKKYSYEALEKKLAEIVGVSK